MAIFSKRHYEALAAALHAAKPTRFRDGAEPAAWEETVIKIASMLSADNYNFNRERFETACNGYHTSPFRWSMPE